jgi:hypothetical protein
MWKTGFFVVNQKTYQIRFRDEESTYWMGEYSPTVVQDWKIISAADPTVVVDSQVTKWIIHEPTMQIRERLVRFMTQKRTVYRNGWRSGEIYPYVVSDNDPNVYLVLCEDRESDSISCPAKEIIRAESHLHVNMRR